MTTIRREYNAFKTRVDRVVSVLFGAVGHGLGLLLRLLLYKAMS